MDLFSGPHRRFNPLFKSWVLVSPQRIYRPWDGKIENLNPIKNQSTNNPLQPNAVRSNGEKNPNYESTFIFTNDFPALLDSNNEFKSGNLSDDFNFFQVLPAKGKCQVMCFHPSSTITLASMEVKDVIDVINKWISILKSGSSIYDWIQIFENRGEMMGSSNPHPHCQIWSTRYLPNIPTIKNNNLKDYYNKYKNPMLFDYVNKEIQSQERIVYLNDSWVCLVPYWAEWPFETMLISRRINVHRLSDLNTKEIEDLAIIMQELLKKYNKLFNAEFPYSMGWFGAPTGSYLHDDSSHWTLHAVYYPPLLRSATIKKYFAGFELFCEIQRDLTPEKAAAMLKDCQ